MVDLSTTYLGLKLANPLVAASSPLSKTIDGIKQVAAAGAGALVMYSLFEEQINHESRELDHFLSRNENASAEALSYFPEMDDYNVGPDGYLDLIKQAKKAVKIPVIGSLNGVSTGGWIDYAKRIEQAGADALELNLYFLATDPELGATAVEDNHVKLVADIRKAIKLPLAVKLSPFFTALPNLAKRLAGAGADGLVLFNRFYQPDFNLEQMEVASHLALSTSNELRLPLRWTAILHGRVKADLALTTGVHTSQDALKAIAAGANCVQIASELLAHGVGRLGHILGGMSAWMAEYDYKSISQMRGCMSQQKVAEPAAFERANYIKVLNSFGE
jgi:dihydroorotate dehydrogenase (fumarate)